MDNVDEILERLKGMEVVISNPEELTERIVSNFQKKRKDFGAPNITYQLAGVEQKFTFEAQE